MTSSMARLPSENLDFSVPLPRRDRPRVLWIEDTESNRTVVAMALELNGYEAIAMTHGQEAIAWAQTHRPDLVLLDIQMPGISGYEVARTLRQTPHLQTAPIVALTALCLDEERDAILAAGCDRYLLKPVTIQELLDALEDFLPRPAAAES
ncbi:MAG: response regulator [Oscillatoriales cyanobacterium SM2_1_8]|nr:response regulator [Oscillatoriales cyanobacterium SM2_1_8]